MNVARPPGAVAALGFGVAGLSFGLYPVLRPYADETTLAGAQAMASPAWVAAHTFGMVAFIALTAGMWALTRLRVADGRAGGAATALTWLGVSLVLPYYGGETFGLHAIGQRASSSGDASLLAMVEAFRYGPVALTSFGIGLLLLAAGGIALALAGWRASAVTRYTGLVVGAAMATYLPQFFFPPALRIAHGVILGAGCLMVAAVAWREGRTVRERAPSPAPA